jgi:hypothetical protein
MKILRLESDTDLFKSVFTNNLAVPLQVAPNAKVAIKTLSMQFEPVLIVINANNNTITFNLGGNAYEAIIPSKSYNISGLVNTFQAYMNNICPSDTASSIGMEFLWGHIAGDDRGGYKVNIAFVVNDSIDINEGNAILLNALYNGGFYKDPAAGNIGLYNANVITQHYSCLGGWNYSFVIAQQPDAEPTDAVKDSKWFYGMAEGALVQSVTSASTIIQYMDNGVGSSDTGTYIYKNIDSEMVDTGLVISIGDVIDVVKMQITVDIMQVLYSIKQGTNPAQVFYGRNYINSNVPVPDTQLDVFCKFGDDTGKILFTSTSYIPSSTSQVSSEGAFTQTSTESVLNIMKYDKTIKAVDPVAVEIDLTQSLANTLGFKELQLIKTAVSFKWTSDTDVTTNLFNNDLMVEVPEFGFDGYDQRTQQKRSILMVITSGAVQQSTQAKGLETFELSYTDNFPTYMNINNSIATTFSNLTVRVTSESQPISIVGKMVCTLLVKDETDFEIKL